MALGPSTVAINGSRFAVPTWNAYSPNSYGAQTTGVPQVTPSYPPYIGGGYASGGQNTPGTVNNTTVQAAAHPFSSKSPVLFCVIGLLLSLFILKGVHWRTTTLEGFNESGHAGPVREAASESA